MACHACNFINDDALRTYGMSKIATLTSISVIVGKRFKMRLFKLFVQFAISYVSVTATTSYRRRSLEISCEAKNRVCHTCLLGCGGSARACSELPALAIAPRIDGVGAFTLHIIGGLAYAAQLGLRFSGALADRHASMRLSSRGGSGYTAHPHGVNRSFIFNALFGDSNSVYRDVNSNYVDLYKLELKRYPALTAKLLRPNNRDDTAAMNASIAQLKFDIKEYQASLYYLPISDSMPPPPLFNDFMSEYFLHFLRRDAACGLRTIFQKHSYFASTSSQRRGNDVFQLNGIGNGYIVTVALHVRRGDLYESNKLISERFLRDEYYFEVVAALRQVLEPKGIQLQVHAWTSCIDEAQCQYARNIVTRVYGQQGIKLHVDAEDSASATLDTLVAWSHFVHADVFVMSPSSFSQVPALLNPRCVVFASRWRQRHGRYEQRYAALPMWINFKSTIVTENRSVAMRRALAQALPMCLPNR